MNTRLIRVRGVVTVSARLTLPSESARASSGGSRLSVLDSPPLRSTRRGVIAAAGAVSVHAACVALAMLTGPERDRAVERSPAISELIHVELPAEEPAPSEPARDEPPPVAQRAHAPRVRAKPAAPPPAAAQAGRVLDAPVETVDFGDTFVAGTNSTYAAGLTEAGGTAAHAVRDARARAHGATGASGSAQQTDRSRGPQLAGRTVWDCPFPEEADDIGIDHAAVTLRVEVSATGSVVSAQASGDPSHGFGREARRCALSKRWAPALDPAGHAIAGVAIVNVKFDR